MWGWQSGGEKKVVACVKHTYLTDWMKNMEVFLFQIEEGRKVTEGSCDEARGELVAGGWFQNVVIVVLAEGLSNSSEEVWRISVGVALLTDCLASAEVMSEMACVGYWPGQRLTQVTGICTKTLLE